jgi:hypothetical protein
MSEVEYAQLQLSQSCTVLCRVVTDLSRDQPVLRHFLFKESFKFNILEGIFRVVIPRVTGSSPVGHPIFSMICGSSLQFEIKKVVPHLSRKSDAFGDVCLLPGCALCSTIEKLTPG